MLLRLGLPLLGDGAYKKKLNVKPCSLVPISNMGYQSCNGQKKYLCKPVSFDPNERLAYKLVDRLNFAFSKWCFHVLGKSWN